MLYSRSSRTWSSSSSFFSTSSTTTRTRGQRRGPARRISTPFSMLIPSVFQQLDDSVWPGHGHAHRSLEGMCCFSCGEPVPVLTAPGAQITKAVDIRLTAPPPGSRMPIWLSITGARASALIAVPTLTFCPPLPDKHVLTEDEKKTQECVVISP